MFYCTKYIKIPSELRGSRNASIATTSRCRSSLWEEDWSSMLQLGDGSWPSAQGAAQMKELEAGSLNLSDMFPVWNRFWRLQTWLQFESEEMNLESFLNYCVALHYQKKSLPTRCMYVSCGPLVLVFFESPSASLDLSDPSVDKVNAEAPTFALSSWVSYLGFRHRAALDSANVSKYQPYKNLTILAVQIPAVSNQIPAVQKPNDLSRTDTSRE